MNDLIIYFLTALIFSFVGFLIGKLLTKLLVEKEKTVVEKEKSTLEERVALLQQSKDIVEDNYIELQKELKINQQEKERLLTVNTRQDSENKNLQLKLDEHKSEVEKLQKKFTNDFEVLANKILEEKSNKFTVQNKENLKIILHPLQEKIKIFEDKVEQTHKESIDYHAALRQQIIGLKEMNLQMSKETINLTKALKGDSKTQGNWGELVLERVLEKSGLEKDREYYVQQSFTNEDGKRILPDVVIHLPDNKKMIVDSKVSLTAYEQYINEDDESLKVQFLKEHITSLKRHVDQLSEKKYEDIYKIESPDFVLLFIPIEPAFAVAINTDNHLYNKAFEKNIVIVTPTTLLATLRTIDSMWNNEKQQKNAIEIARQAGALYDKFQSFLNDLITIGKRIDESKKEYSNAMNKLFEGRGNLISSVEKLKKMGAKAKKAIPENIIKRANE
ncbi:DNA recombination protein RmuC [Polaribacter glomeratus]|uniref:DNA polymerase V n=1 Tax=Polaribacter glomeratus TaxID=102 RepID=A0A2S7WVS9_9FLAO|nr:DNA recombination protein RmuC [Polaribacter glomeratus]PQJ81703.1 DNA polymerase V [Polaribacter glomeratus]TXD66505.1 DNA recombination protein RmuC [Polaribacter glomeratus]